MRTPRLCGAALTQTRHQSWETTCSHDALPLPLTPLGLSPSLSPSCYLIPTHCFLQKTLSSPALLGQSLPHAGPPLAAALAAGDDLRGHRSHPPLEGRTLTPRARVLPEAQGLVGKSSPSTRLPSGRAEAPISHPIRAAIKTSEVTYPGGSPPLPQRSPQFTLKGLSSALAPRRHGFLPVGSTSLPSVRLRCLRHTA